ncbi:MAG: NAD-dependent epimerase/dehydratase family protein [Actinobacteria bacterium]|nr:NAD-dependent epimerase/dehydratase family protein [Actinomycetota bacterium]
MRALVTGSEGFIGSHLTAALRSNGHDVIGLDRRVGVGPGHRRLDLADPLTLSPLHKIVTAEIDVVFHLAARPGVRDSHPAIDELRHRDNVLATRRLFESTPIDVPVVVTSSSSVYGGATVANATIRPCREGDPLRPVGGYARSKAAMEELCHQRRTRGGTVAVVRPFTVVGEGQRPDMALSLWLAAVSSGRPIRILGSPERTRDLTDIRGVIRGLTAVADIGFNGTVNLGTGLGHRLIDVAHTLLETLGKPGEIVVAPAAAEERPATLADTTLCTGLLGFTPTTDLGDVVARIVEAGTGNVSVTTTRTAL